MARKRRGGGGGGGGRGQHGREGSRSAWRWGGVGWARVAVFSAALLCVWGGVSVCDGGEEVGFPSASTVVYVAGPGAPGYLPVCVAYGHLALSKLNNYLPVVSASDSQDHMPLFT